MIGPATARGWARIWSLGFRLGVGPLLILGWTLTHSAAHAGGQPNLLLIVADDLGYGDLGSYGQKVIATPELDRLAAEGLRFTDFYAGAPVCAPSRSVLMTGRHAGRTRIRGNFTGTGEIGTLLPEDVTVAELLRDAGYRTGLIGKWGLGEEGTTGHPLRQGFDTFYGYLNQVHAHNYFPEFLWRGAERVELRNRVQRVSRVYGGFRGGWATEKHEYSHDLFVEEALSWLDNAANRSQPFFLFLSLTIPHANNEARYGVGDGQEVPSYGAYETRDWPDPDKGQAAMISRLDADVGRLTRKLEELGVAEDTLVLFTSDNGPHAEGGNDLNRFEPSGPLRGIKRDLYDGGIRVPLIAWWPGTIESGRVSSHPSYFGDLMATAAELAGVRPPRSLQSVSLVPSLLGRGGQRQHEVLYFEFYERGGAQAVRSGRWKAVKPGIGPGPLELYDLSVDLGEASDVADRHPEVVRRLAEAMKNAHVPDPQWRVSGPRRSPPSAGRGRDR